MADSAVPNGDWDGILRMHDYTDRELAFLRELANVERILAEALGYPYHELYGWVVGDHTPVSLAMEVRIRMQAAEAARAPKKRKLS